MDTFLLQLFKVFFCIIPQGLLRKDRSTSYVYGVLSKSNPEETCKDNEPQSLWLDPLTTLRRRPVCVSTFSSP